MIIFTVMMVNGHSRSKALTQGIVSASMQNASTPSSSSSSHAAPLDSSTHHFQVIECDSDNAVVHHTGGNGTPQLPGGQNSSQVPAQKDGKPIVVFKVSHKAPAGMKRPLTAVDNIRSGDIAVQVYNVFEYQGEGENKFQLCRTSDTDNVQLLRLLGVSSREGSAMDSSLMRKLLVWEHAGSVPIDVGQLKFALKTDFAIGIVEDMVASRAFIGSGRAFEFHGNPTESQQMEELAVQGIVCRATGSDGSAGDALWYLTQKAAVMLEA